MNHAFVYYTFDKEKQIKNKQKTNKAHHSSFVNFFAGSDQPAHTRSLIRAIAYPWNIR